MLILNRYPEATPRTQDPLTDGVCFVLGPKEKCTESSHELALSGKTVLSGPIKGTNFQTRQVTTWVTYTPKTVFSDPIRARKQDQPSQDFSDQVSLRSLAYSLVESKLSPPIRP